LIEVVDRAQSILHVLKPLTQRRNVGAERLFNNFEKVSQALAGQPQLVEVLHVGEIVELSGEDRRAFPGNNLPGRVRKRQNPFGSDQGALKAPPQSPEAIGVPPLREFDDDLMRLSLLVSNGALEGAQDALRLLIRPLAALANDSRMHMRLPRFSRGAANAA